MSSPQHSMIDVSSNNHLTDQPIQWSRVKTAGFGYVMIKATEGTGYVNPWLGRDANAAAQAGLKVGYYHFAQPTQGPAVAQADYALAAIKGLPRDLGLALDLEVRDGMAWDVLAKWAQAFHAQAKTVVDHSPLYVNLDFLENLPGAPWGERLWLASTSRPRREVWAWQMTKPAVIVGIEAPTDVGYLHPYLAAT